MDAYIRVYAENGDELNSYYSSVRPNIGEIFVDSELNEHTVKQVKHIVSQWGELQNIMVIVSNDSKKINLEFSWRA